MSRPKKLTVPEVSARLLALKRMVANLRDAMPRAAEEMRREACEEIDDLVVALRSGVAS
jgi:hypothetical protein